MAKNKKISYAFPSVKALEAELERVNRIRQYISFIKSAVCSLAVIAAFAILVTNIWLPVLEICGNSMDPTMKNGDIVVSVKGVEPERGDLTAFYVGNSLLIKRYIAGPGDIVDIDSNGNVYVNGDLLDEPYLDEKALGCCDIEFPYQVPESRYFLLGDNRSTSVDSRSTEVGCITESQVLGKVVFRVLPLSEFGRVE